MQQVQQDGKLSLKGISNPNLSLKASITSYDNLMKCLLLRNNDDGMAVESAQFIQKIYEWAHIQKKKLVDDGNVKIDYVPSVQCYLTRNKTDSDFCIIVLNEESENVPLSDAVFVVVIEAYAAKLAEQFGVVKKED